MKTFTIILVILLLTGCVTQKRCERKFPPQVIHTDSTITNTITIFRDTTIYIYLPGDTVIDTVKVDVQNGVANSRPSIHETDLAWSMAQIVDNKLIHQLIMKDKTLEMLIKNAIRENATHSERRIKVKEIVKENYLTRWQWAQLYLGRISGIFLLLYIGYKMVRRSIKIPY